MEIHEVIGRHKGVALQFSGGKDSLACLYLLRPYWNKLSVVWLNTGDAAEETVLQMAEIKALVTHFLEIKGDQPRQVVEYGVPADVLSIWDSPLGHDFMSGRKFKVQPAISCCWQNIWEPLHQAMKGGGYTLVIRGQRNEEARKAPVDSGVIEDGVEYLFPIQDWTRKDVAEYLESEGVKLPQNYDAFDSSLDCLHCTAYLDENRGKLGYLRRHHPAAATEVMTRLRYIRASVEAELHHLEAYA